MAKKVRSRTKKEPKEEKALLFDPEARLKYLKSFRKRKQDRRKKAQHEALDKERQERIEVHREHREDIKKRWKDVAWAERTVDRVLQKRLQMAEERRLALANGDPAAIAAQAIKDRDAESDNEVVELNDFDLGGKDWMPRLEDMDPEMQEFARPRLVTINFAIEGDKEEDPFGDCEVTTTAVALSKGPPKRGKDEEEEEPTTALALRRRGLRGDDSDEEHNKIVAFCGRDGKPITSQEELEEHRRKRKVNLRKEEDKRRKAQEKKRQKMEQEKKKMRKKSKKDKKPRGKNVKAGAKTRRRRMKKVRAKG
eukprot:TRINITY_DN81090_c0_g1_i1.p2 TRINITY_DN81090_c0_g1~~TRINITY_DN81090_c0_g1_i1.p2  ORF type:complete len:309 (+),score=133.60 TRINITY_DN81090_c0_g1_i1:85-1011(+)